MDQHLTVREACRFSGKSESTIKRLIREIAGTAEHQDRSQLLPSSDEVAHRRSTGDMFVWKINQDLLIKRFPKSAGLGSKDSRIGKPESVGINDPATTIDILRDQLQSKDRQIRTLETQLDRKDDQIKNLNDRMHESNVLMRELQNRLAISAAPAEKLAIIKSESVVQSNTRSGGVKAKSKTSRSIFRKFFGLG